MDNDFAIRTLRTVRDAIDQAMVDLEDADPDFELHDAHRSLKDAFEGASDDLSRLESGAFG